METYSEPKFVLTSIRFSHYVEKVRWTLDRLGVAYHERPLMPIVHFLVTPFASAFSATPDSQSTRFSTPILKTDTGQVIVKSSKIMRYLSERYLSPEESLYPSQEVIDLDEHYNRFLGPHTRRLFYINVLNRPEIMSDIADKNVSNAQAILFKTIYPLCKRIMSVGLGVTREQAEKGLGYIYKEFEAVEKRLGDGRPFLFGDRITAADISFACLGGVLTLPSPAEGYGGYLPPPDTPCPDLSKIAAEFRDREAGRWVLRLFREERGRRLVPGKPLLPGLSALSNE